jgi:hypothetical protein
MSATTSNAINQLRFDRVAGGGVTVATVSMLAIHPNPHSRFARPCVGGARQKR